LPKGPVRVDAGLRIEAEALQLRWADVDLKRGLLTVPAAYAKNGTSRTVPLNSVLRAALIEMKTEATSDYVFVGREESRSGRSRTPSRRRAARRGSKAVSPHTLRHTFASRLTMAGVDARTIQELGGWKTMALVELSPRHKAEAVERIATNSATLFQQPQVAAEGGNT
jgi:integrase